MIIMGYDDKYSCKYLCQLFNIYIITLLSILLKKISTY